MRQIIINIEEDSLAPIFFSRLNFGDLLENISLKVTDDEEKLVKTITNLSLINSRRMPGLAPEIFETALLNSLQIVTDNQEEDNE